MYGSVVSKLASVQFHIPQTNQTAKQKTKPKPTNKTLAEETDLCPEELIGALPTSRPRAAGASFALQGCTGESRHMPACPAHPGLVLRNPSLRRRVAQSRKASFGVLVSLLADQWAQGQLPSVVEKVGAWP